MQTRFRLPILMSMAMLLIFSSCSKKTNKEGRYIPKNASMAILVDGAALSSKLPWEEVKQNDAFKELYMDSSMQSYMKTAMENPENTGVDVKKNILFFIQRDSLGGFIAMEGTVKDAAKFKQFNSSMNTGAAETEKDGVHFLNHDKMLSSWDKDKFVIIIDVPQLNLSNPYGSMSPGRSASKRDIIAAAQNIYSLSEDNSLGNDEKFSDLVGTKGDIHFWMNINELYSNAPGMAALSMMNINRLYEGTLLTGTASFENGKIDVDVKSYYGKEMNDLLKKYSNGKINTNMIKRIPGKEPAALFALNYDPDGLREFIKLTGMEGFINIGASKFGITLDDFIKANKGDIVLSVSDIQKSSDGSMHPDILFATSIGDKNSFGKLIEAGNKLTKGGNMGGAPPVSYNQNENYFAIGTQKQSVDKYISGGSNSFPFLDKISGSSSAFYLNFQLLMSGMSNQFMKDSLDNIVYESSMKMWDNMIATGGGFKDGGAVQHLEINLVDKNTNSLKQLNKYMETIGHVEHEKKANMDKWMGNTMDDKMADSIMMKVDTTQ